MVCKQQNLCQVDFTDADQITIHSCRLLLSLLLEKAQCNLVHLTRSCSFSPFKYFSYGANSQFIINTRFLQIAEDLNIVLNIQRKFSYLQSIPGVFAVQRPYLPIQHPYITKTNFHMMETSEMALSSYNMNQVAVNRLLEERSNYFSMIAINMGRSTPHDGTQGPTLWSGPPSLPNMSCSIGALLSRLPNEVPSSYNPSQVPETNRIDSRGQRVKIEECGFHVADDGDDQKGKARS